MPHPFGDAEVPVGGTKGTFCPQGSSGPKGHPAATVPPWCPRGAASTASSSQLSGLFIGEYGRGLPPDAAPALAQPGSSLPAPPVAPSPRALPGRAPLSSYPQSVLLAPASWGPQGSIVPPINTPKCHTPPGAQPLWIRPQQERGAKGGQGAQGAPSTHPSATRPPDHPSSSPQRPPPIVHGDAQPSPS